MARAVLLGLLALGLTAAAVLTWGSLGSAVMVLCLMLMAASLAYQKFLTNRDDDSFRDE